MSHPSPKPKLTSVKDYITLFICGLFMGTADIVPGISGGAMALLLGIYEDLLKSISSINFKAISYLLRFQIKDFFNHIAWEFLATLLCGILCIFILLSQFFNFILNHEVYRVYLYSIFFGLISAAIVFCGKQITAWRPIHPILLCAAAIFSFFFTHADLKPAQKEPLYNVQLPEDAVPVTAKPLTNYDVDTRTVLNVPASTLSAMISKGIISKDAKVFSQKEQRSGVAADFVDGSFLPGINGWLVMCGAIAIMAMLMPGISGSYMLTILGAYPIAIGAVADFVYGIRSGHFEVESFYILFSLIIGIVAGALTFSHVVKWLLAHYHNNMIAVLTGVMLGAIHTVWPFRSYEYLLMPLKLDKGPHLQVIGSILPDFSSSLFWISLGCTVFGFCFVLTLEYVAHKHKLRTRKL